jgi:hypothetical protein
MKKTQTTEYILGIITGISITIAVWALTQNTLTAQLHSNVQEVTIVNPSWNPVNVRIEK